MSEKLKSFLQKAFAILAVELSKHLGDRSEYIGASDLAGCPRKAALNRIRPQKERTAAEQMVMAIGHAVEDIIGRLFLAGGVKNLTREVEYVHPEFTFIKCHCDFVYESDTEIRIRELKSTKGNPDDPYPTWVNQVHVQMGLAQICVPEKTITGSIMAVDRAKGGCQEYTGYTPNPQLTEVFVEKAKKIWAAVIGEGPVPAPEPGDGNLCGFCPHRSDCPAHDITKLNQLPAHEAKIAAEYRALLDDKKAIETKLDKLKCDLLSFTGDKYRGAAGELVVNVSFVGETMTVDSKKLKADYPEIYAKVSKSKAGYSKLEVK